MQAKQNMGIEIFIVGAIKKKTGCWETPSHRRRVGPELALAQSCDGFFYELAKRTGIENIVETARNFGLGSKSGVNLKGEKNG